MLYRNNLTIEWGNAYFRVTDPFEVYIRVGIAVSNTYYGAAQLFGTVYERLCLQPGDEIHDLHGGVWLVREGESWPVRMSVPDWHPFEGRYHSNEDHVWPLERLQRLEAKSAPITYDHRGELTTPGAGVGRSIDSVRAGKKDVEP